MPDLDMVTALVTLRSWLAADTVKTLLMVALLIGVVGAMFWSLRVRDRMPESESSFSFDKLVMNPDGTMAREWALIFAAFVPCAWFFVVQVVRGVADTTLMLAFAGVFAIPALKDALATLRGRATAPGSTVTTTVRDDKTTVRVEPTEPPAPPKEPPTP